jgi:hypothetical protein
MEDLNNGNYPSRWKILLLGLFHILWAVLCGILIYRLWPNDGKLESIGEKNILYMVMLAGAAGSFIHSAGSFISFVGDKKLSITWFWWYILRPLIGMGVALVFFIVFRAGLMAGTNADINPYGLLALSALAGMFSDRATLKLQELFETLFKPDDKRKGRLAEDGSSDPNFDNPDSKG